jgi:hypothetical protein
MGKVIPFAFGKKAPESEQPSPDTAEAVPDEYEELGPLELEGEALLKAQKDLLYILANKEYVSRLRDHIERLGDVIFSMAGFAPHDANIQLRRQALAGDTLAELCAKAEQFNEMNCRTQPSYVGAITLEYHARVETALALMKGTLGEESQEE